MAAPSVATSGIASVPVGTELFVAVATLGGVFVWKVDVSSQVASDITILRIYDVVASGGTSVPAFVGAYSHAQVQDAKYSPPVPVTEYIRCSIENVRGGQRNFRFALLVL